MIVLFFFRTSDNIHRADQEPTLQVLGPRLRQLRARDPETFRVGGTLVYGGTHAAPAGLVKKRSLV